MKSLRYSIAIGFLLLMHASFAALLSNDVIDKSLPYQTTPQAQYSYGISQNFPLFNNGFNQYGNFDSYGSSVQPQKNQQSNGASQNYQSAWQPQQNQQSQQQYNQQNNQQNYNQQQFNQQSGQYFQLNQPNFQNQNKGAGSSIQNVEPNLLIPISQKPISESTNSLDCNDDQHNNNNENKIKQLCQPPRTWNGVKCVCPDSGVFLSGKCYNEVPKENTRDIFSLRYINRNYDGSENNPKYPEYGAKGTPLLRLTEPNYQDKKSEPIERVPGPRQASRIVGDIKKNITWNEKFNHMFITWSQFIGNDITYTPVSANEYLNIPVPRCDKFFDKNCTAKQKLNFARSIYQLKDGIRTNINAVSSWLDASHIYGSDKKTADSLREFKNGKLKLTADALLLQEKNGEFIAGDRRVNQNVLLAALQTVFVREHNRICDNVTARNSSFTDEEVYQIARNYVIGLIQHITFDEWLPNLIGKKAGNFSYDKNTNPGIYTEFQVAGLRIFDSFIPPTVFIMQAVNQTILNKVGYKDIVENPGLINRTSLAQYLSGAMGLWVKPRSIQLIDDLRNLFITPEFPDQNTDLFAINIQRGRDHGVGSLKDIRDALELSTKSILEAFTNLPNIDCLESLYEHPDNVDLWLALIGQKQEQYSILGEIGNKLWTLQMRNIRNGDIYWYEYAYPESVVKQIKQTYLSDVIERNGLNKQLPRPSFTRRQIPVPPPIDRNPHPQEYTPPMPMMMGRGKD